MRIELLELLDRPEGGATKSTWNAKTQFYCVTVFPQMLRWLGHDEAAALGARFDATIVQVGLQPRPESCASRQRAPTYRRCPVSGDGQSAGGEAARHPAERSDVVVPQPPMPSRLATDRSAPRVEQKRRSLSRPALGGQRSDRSRASILSDDHPERDGQSSGHRSGTRAPQRWSPPLFLARDPARRDGSA